MYPAMASRLPTRTSKAEEHRMTLGEWERKLREKERELLTDMARMETDFRATDFLDQTTAEWNLFTQVRDALQRIRLGTFGTCTECGREIEAQRLSEVPWTAFCLQHQNLRERELVRQPV